VEPSMLETPRKRKREREREREFRVPGRRNSWSLWRMNRLRRGGGGRQRGGGSEGEAAGRFEDALRNELGRE